MERMERAGLLNAIVCEASRGSIIWSLVFGIWSLLFGIEVESIAEQLFLRHYETFPRMSKEDAKGLTL